MEKDLDIMIQRMKTEESGAACRRIQAGENDYNPFGYNKINTEHPVQESSPYNVDSALLSNKSFICFGPICDAQSKIRYAIEELKQASSNHRLEQTKTFNELILLELDIEEVLLKLKKIAVGYRE